MARAGTVRPTAVDVPAGTPVRELLRRVGQPPEGCVALVDGRPCPLDHPIDRPTTLTVLPTFSGG